MSPTLALINSLRGNQSLQLANRIDVLPSCTFGCGIWMGLLKFLQTNRQKADFLWNVRQSLVILSHSKTVPAAIQHPELRSLLTKQLEIVSKAPHKSSFDGWCRVPYQNNPYHKLPDYLPGQAPYLKINVAKLTSAQSLVSFMVDVEGIRIFPRAPELFGGAVAMDRPRSVHALHVRVQAAPNGHLRFACQSGSCRPLGEWLVFGGFLKWRYPQKWMVYNGKSVLKWMILWGYPYFRKTSIER